MTSLNVAEAKRRFSDLLGRVADGGETILITRRGKPMAKLVPVAQAEHDVEAARKTSTQGLGRIPGLLRHRAPDRAVSVEDMRLAVAEEAAASHRRATRTK